MLCVSGTSNVSVKIGEKALPSASEQWQAVLRSSASTQEEIPPEIVAAKTADVRHSQALTDDASTAEAHQEHSDWTTVQGKTPLSTTSGPMKNLCIERLYSSTMVSADLHHLRI